MSRRSVSREIDGIGDQLAMLRKDLGAIADQVQTLLQHQAEGSQQLLRSISEDVNEHSQKLMESAQDQIASSYGDLEAMVKRNPFTAMAIAAGIGLIAGTLSRHK
ncbi:MAG TPA: DUF883 C-terminal domain-containing protein [Aestuariivirgaceae bacterium]